MKWLNDLKIAVVTEDLDALDTLLEKDVKYETSQEMEEAGYVLKLALDLLMSKKEESLKLKKQLEQSMNFLKTSDGKVTNRIDVKY